MGGQAKSRTFYCDTAKSHIKLMGLHWHHPHPFFSLEYTLLNPSDVSIYKRHISQYECMSRMKPSKKPHVVFEPLAGHPLSIQFPFEEKKSF